MNKLRPTTAVIAVAGYGTRMLPITKAIEKCMLPVNNRPVIDYVVKDCADAGIKRIIFVVGEGSSQLRHYYSPYIKLEKYLSERKKQTELDLMQNIGYGIEFEFVVQPAESKYGTSVPLELAKEGLEGEETFLYLMGDDFIFNNGKKSSINELIDAWQKSNDDHSLIGVEIPADQVDKYGVLVVNSASQLEGIVEKPNVNDAPSNLINVSKYIFNSSILDHLKEHISGKQDGEYYITDVLNMAISAGETVLVSSTSGRYLDCGKPEGWLFANNYLASKKQ